MPQSASWGGAPEAANEPLCLDFVTAAQSEQAVEAWRSSQSDQPR